MNMYLASVWLGLITYVVAQVPARNISTNIENAVDTECKTCPYSLCTNVVAYEGSANVTALCWTRGTAIDNDRTWLRTTDNCYITQYDVASYDGEWEEDLPYCGRDSEKEFYATQDAVTKYNTECNIMPWISSDNIHYHKYGTDLTLTCYTDDQWPILDDATWFKTTSNCYVSQTGLAWKPDRAELDDCGPIPHLEINQTYVPPPDRARRSPIDLSQHLNKRYLVNVTVGEDYALCHKAAASNSTVQRRYRWNQSLILQCLVWNDTPDWNETYWSLTTDFCYVRSVDLWESPEGDNYRFPRCSLFE